jgi:hypothetical protein
MSVTDMMSDLERARFFGSIEVKFEAGRVVLVKKTETIKASGDKAEQNYRDTRGVSHDHNS